MLDVVQIPVLNDNYIYLIGHEGTKTCAVVDPALAEPVLAAAKERGWRITHILNTHWHGDHTGGNEAIKQATGCTVIGPRGEAAKIPAIDTAVGEGDIVALPGGDEAYVLDVPGHTAGHIAYHFATQGLLFCGDTLFALGCGRLFEGTAEQMFASLHKLAHLPDNTEVYCAHEYTEANGRFALTVEPGNDMLVDRMDRVHRNRASGLPTVPFVLGIDKATNPFLTAATVEEFARRRAAKDVFKG